MKYANGNERNLYLIFHLKGVKFTAYEFAMIMKEDRLTSYTLHDAHRRFAPHAQ